VSGDLTRNWGAFVGRGIVAILFGLCGFLLPGITLTALIVLFGAFALVDGILAIIAAVRAQAGAPWWALVLRGIFGIAAGAIALLWPGITAVALVFVIGFWAIASGIVEIIGAIRLRKVVEREWLLGLAGALSVLFGVLIVMNPGAGALAVLWLICTYAIVLGILFIWLGLKLRSINREVERGTRETTGRTEPPPSGEQRAAD